MEITFNNILEQIRSLSKEEKEEVKFLIEKDLIEVRRDEIYQNYIKSKNEEKNLIFSDDLNTLKNILG